MGAIEIKVFLLFILLNSLHASAQEWSNLKSYRRETGNTFLRDGCWLKIDRKEETEVWKQANKFNLDTENGNRKYKTIAQKRDFYLWYDIERKRLGHEIKWIGIAAIAAEQLSKTENRFIRIFIIRNKEVVKFANEGSERVFEFAFPLLKKVYFSNEIIKGKEAEHWAMEYGLNEQCVILEPLYKELSHKAFKKLDRMAKGEGIFYLGVPKGLRYEGKLEDCQSRFEHGIKQILPYYLSKQK